MEFAFVNLGDNLPHPRTGVAQSDVAKHAGLMAQAAAAEAAGFDVFLLGEHHFNYFMISSPVVVLAAIAQPTATLRLGTGVPLLPTRAPVFVADACPALARRPGGRVAG